ncbi:Colicin V secretion protein CvaA [Usitatibacter rugosus]|uniref:Colicin V secretion protein CvaA n=1 Tax=Usitatibacter rugosus TaxID=2732067 RepID=A0A6M4H0B7_9PROT|nr:HlyD family efflux transporter periplasmic adaptor subunit [Usitatibacter rugosus]QJR12772.1 Colicin V secretion protein CvaA [Usitatibacter rugosus]
MSSPLFRAEAHDSRATSWLGTIVLMRPVPTVVMTAAASAVSLAIVAFLVWGESTNKARVTGFLTPTSGVARVVATQSGVIESRFVAEGDSVAKGAPLLSLVDPRATDEHGTVGAQVTTSLRERQRALSRQRDLAGTTYLADLESLATRHAKLDAEARKLDDEIDAMRSRSRLAAEEIERAEELERSGFAARAMTDRKRDESLDVRIRISALERARDAAHREAEALQSEAAAAKARYLAQLAALDGQRASLGQERAERSAAYRSVITAPHAGIVASMLVEAGQAATQGTPLLTLLPADVKLEAHLFAPSRSIGFVRTGQAVLLRYPAFPAQKFGSHHAHVTAVSRSALAPGDLGYTPADGNRESLYRIRATLDSQAMLAYGKPEPLQAGMLVEADILLDRRRLIEWIFDPLLSLSGRL